MFKFYAKRNLKFFKRYRFVDQNREFVSKFVSRGNSFSRRYKSSLISQKLFNIFYGGLRKKYLKKELLRRDKISFNKLRYRGSQYFFFLKRLELRLDVVLYRAGFGYSLKKVRQYVKHGHILVNDRIVLNNSFKVSENDFISVKSTIKSRNFIRKSLKRYHFWPIPPNYLLVNYKTLQIVVLKIISGEHTWFFNHSLKLSKVVPFTKFNYNF